MSGFFSLSGETAPAMLGPAAGAGESGRTLAVLCNALVCADCMNRSQIMPVKLIKFVRTAFVDVVALSRYLYLFCGVYSAHPTARALLNFY